jgi:hypothetical protein
MIQNKIISHKKFFEKITNKKVNDTDMMKNIFLHKKRYVSLFIKTSRKLLSHSLSDFKKYMIVA